jgi:hypothetical protein
MNNMRLFILDARASSCFLKVVIENDEFLACEKEGERERRRRKPRDIDLGSHNGTSTDTACTAGHAQATFNLPGALA